MQLSIRHADELSATAYPLESGGPAPWQRSADAWCCDVPLTPCPADHIIVPSLALATPARYRFELRTGGSATPLHPVPAEPSDVSRAEPPSPAVRSEIDCWHTSAPLDDAVVRVIVEGGETARHLLTVSVRPLSIDPVPPAASANVTAPAPKPLSQMTANPAIAARICSPTALAMAIDATPSGWLELVADCRDPATGMYGVWPYAIRAAARIGRLGAVELISDWTTVLRLLAAGIRPVASIRYGEGQLEGAPMKSTGGHLVVLYGLEGGCALVADPAAAEPASVLRRYPLEAFSQAWLAYRGAAYIVPA
jgi:hypothetical protein